MRRAAVAVACLLVAGCGRAEWHEADARLNAAAAAARAEGFAPMRGPHNAFGSFTAPGATTWRVHVEPRRPYFLAAACAMGCDSLDVTIGDADHAESFADTSAGPAPRLVFTPLEGNLQVTVRHGGCSSGRCRWVAQLYERTTTP